MNRKTSLSLLTAALLAGAGADIAAAAPSAAGITGIIVKYHSVSQLQLTQARIANGGRAPSSRPADFAARTQRVQQLSGSPLQFHHQMGTGAYVYQSGKAMSVAEAQTLARKIQQDPAVEYAEPDFVMSPNYLPSSPLYAAKQWDMQASAGEPGAMNLPAAWDLSLGAGVTVAVLDTGYRPHADLKPNLLEPGYNFISDPKRARLPAVAQTNADGSPLLDSNGQPVQNARTNNGLDQGDYSDGSLCRAGNSSWHGTHVAGTIAAAAGDANGLTGVAPKSKLLPLRVLGQCGGASSDIADAMLWAVGATVPGTPVNANVARVLSMSLGGAQPCSRTYRDAIQQVNARNGVVVVAAGNAMKNVRNTNPASCPGVITVASNGKSGGIASYSNYGAITTVTAPGGDLNSGDPGIYSTLNSGATVPGADSYAAFQGTSMATPHVAGLVALMLSSNPSLNWKAVRNILIKTARQPAADCEGCSAGITDAAAAVRAAKAN